jgi:drug/metabolite transporter (DMT)-like permease
MLLGLGGGVVSGAAYALVLHAKTLAPLGLVSALRETSVIFAALFGIVWFGERPRGRRLAAAAVVTAGIVLIALAE